MMGSFKPPEGSFDSEQLAILQEAFNAVWATLSAHRQSHEENGELKTVVSERLCSLAASGVTDVQLLRAMTLSSLELPGAAAE